MLEFTTAVLAVVILAAAVDEVLDYLHRRRQDRRWAKARVTAKENVERNSYLYTVHIPLGLEHRIDERINQGDRR